MNARLAGPARSASPSGADLDLASIDEVLLTTRSFRRRLDTTRPVPAELVEECLELAVHAPSADNRQNWRWVVITDPDLRAKVASLYHFAWKTHHMASAPSSAARRRRDPAGSAVRASSRWLAQNLARIPVLVIPCVVGRPPSTGVIEQVASVWADEFDPRIGRPSVDGITVDDLAPDWTGRTSPLLSCLYYGSIFPAIWSFALALRSRGLGTVITSTHLPFEPDVARLLGIPSIVTQIALLPVGWLTEGPVTAAPRRPARTATYWNRWEHTRPEARGQG